MTFGRALLCCLCLVVLSLVAASAQGVELRSWTSADKKFQVEAQFIEVAKNPDTGADEVVLETTEGNIIRVALEKLSEEDRAFVENAAAADDVSWDFESKRALAAVKKYQASIAKAKKAQEEETKKAHASLMRSLQKELKAQTRAGNLDEANLLSDAIDALKAGKGPRLETAAADGNPGEETPDEPQGKRLPDGAYYARFLGTEWANEYVIQGDTIKYSRRKNVNGQIEEAPRVTGTIKMTGPATFQVEWQNGWREEWKVTPAKILIQHWQSASDVKFKEPFQAVVNRNR